MGITARKPSRNLSGCLNMVDKVALILIYYAVLENKNLCIVFNIFPSFLCNNIHVLLVLWLCWHYQRFQPSRIDRESPELIGSLPIWCLASRSPDFYQILPIYYKILKTREKLLIFRIFGDLSPWNTHIILTFFAKSIMVCYDPLMRIDLIE